MIGRYTNHGLHSVLFRSGSSQWKNYHSFSSRATVSTASVARLSSNAVVSEAEDRFPDPTAQYPGAGTSTTPSAQSQSWERSSPQPPTTVKLHDLLHHGCLPYPQTWAFQQVLLHRRLHQRRRQTQQVQQNQQQPPTARQSSSSPIEDDCDDDFDCVVLLEHSPVYTLGRGADEKHLTFVQQQQKKQQQKIEADEKLYSSEQERAAAHSTLDEVSQKLSRKVRGPGTARLSVDKNMEDQLQDLTRRKAGNSDDGEQSMLTVVERLTESVSPVIAPNGVPVYRVDRGGEVTYHGPSQLVVYPMFDLKGGSPTPTYQADLHWYLRKIEDVILLTLDHYGIEGNRDEINTGVWVGENKIAAVGISSSRWITTHGFALNIDPDLSAFDTSIILPCGIEGRGVTSMAEVLRAKNNDDDENQRIPSIAEVAKVVTRTMEEVFGVTIQ